MNLVKTLTISIFNFIFIAASGQAAKLGCVEIEVNAVVTPASSDNPNGTITLTFRDSSEYEIFLLAQDSQKTALEYVNISSKT
ncbi:hypothetical protein QQ054_36635 [Oscillatoria amoena NRMC-F 0135]|nr:hypothetical protein [Oscillatoria amoena NRMC-F 0135]